MVPILPGLTRQGSVTGAVIGSPGFLGDRAAEDLRLQLNQPKWKDLVGEVTVAAQRP
jgi:hypothetical protein